MEQGCGPGEEPWGTATDPVPGHVPRVALESCAPTDASRAMGHFLEEEEDGVRAAVSPNVTSQVPAPYPQTLTCRQLWLSLKGPQESDSPNT